MSDGDRLRAKRARLADPATRANLVHRLGTGGGDARIAFCEFIDEVILARRVTFVSGAGAGLTVDIANRRLLRVKDLPPDNPHRGVLADPLRPDDRAQLDLVTAAIGAFLDTGGPLTVAEDPLPSRVVADMLGRSANALAGAFGVPLYGGAGEGDGQTGGAPAPALAEIALASRRFGPDGDVAAVSGAADRFAGTGPALAAPLSRTFASILSGGHLTAVFTRPGWNTALAVSETDGTVTETLLDARHVAAGLAALRMPGRDPD